MIETLKALIIPLATDTWRRAALQEAAGGSFGLGDVDSNLREFCNMGAGRGAGVPKVGISARGECMGTKVSLFFLRKIILVFF